LKEYVVIPGKTELLQLSQDFVCGACLFARRIDVFHSHQPNAVMCARI
jgi:hypothetical protein